MPATLALNRLDSIRFFLIAASLGTLIPLIFFRGLTTEKPSLLESVVAWIGAIFSGAFAGFVFVGFYIMIPITITSGLDLINNIGTWFDFQINFPIEFTELIAYYIGLIFALISSFVVTSLTAHSFAAKLYPGSGRVKSVFFELTTYGKSRLTIFLACSLILLGLIFLAAFLTTGSLTVSWFYPVLSAYIFIVSAVPSSFGETIDSDLPKVLEAVGKMFDAIGDKVVLFPITGKPEFDPLLSNIDYFVQRDDNTFAVTVKTKNQSKSKWDPSGLIRSTRALNLFLQQEKGESCSLAIPLMVYGGRKGEGQVSGVRFVGIPNSVINRVLKMKRDEELKEIANLCFRFSDEKENLSPIKSYPNFSREV